MADVHLVALEYATGVTKLAAMKRLSQELASDPEYVAMFLDEVKLAMRLNHPNVVQTYEVLWQGDQLGLAMEYLEGQPLTRVLTRLYRELGLELRLHIVCKILAGLDHAHNLCDYGGSPLGIVHRDIGPQNVFVTYDGHVKVMDFGVAKGLDARAHSRPGRVKGRRTYMAPEQYRCEAVDRRADLYAVGVILWEVLARRRRWQGQTDSEIERALRENVEPPELPAETGLPTNFDAVCRKALAPLPEDRFATAAEMQAEVARLIPAVVESRDLALGRMVSLEFAKERAERRALIDAHLRSLTGPSRSPRASSSQLAQASFADVTAPARSRFATTAVYLAISLAGALVLAAVLFAFGQRVHSPVQTAAPRPGAAGRLTIASHADSDGNAGAPGPGVPAPTGPVEGARPLLPAPDTVRVGARAASSGEPVASWALALRDGRAGPVAQARPNDARTTRHKRRLLADQQRLAPLDRDWSLPALRTPRTLARPLDINDPYAP
jgi:serine/threonine protein kinase